MASLLVLGIFCIFVAICTGVLFSGEDSLNYPLGFLFFICSITFITLFALQVRDTLKDGSPLNNIGAGTYKVAPGMIYVAGGNVTMELEIPDERSIQIPSGNKIEHIFSFQFPEKAFDGVITKNAKKLVVTEENILGKYKRLRLEQ